MPTPFPTPALNTLLVSPIEDPGEKALIEVVGGIGCALTPAVIEASTTPGFAVGDVVWSDRRESLSIALDFGHVFGVIYAQQVRLHMTAEVDEVVRKNTTPKALKARRDAAEAKREIVRDINGN